MCPGSPSRLVVEEPDRKRDTTYVGWSSGTRRGSTTRKAIGDRRCEAGKARPLVLLLCVVLTAAALPLLWSGRSWVRAGRDSTRIPPANATGARTPEFARISPRSSPSSPPAQICGNAGMLHGPATQPPNSVRVDVGRNLNDLTQASPPGTTFWLSPGTHSLGAGEFGQVIPRDGNVYIGAPGAVLDGQKINRYAFTQQATNVTIRYLTIQNFGPTGSNNDAGVVNQGAATGWLIEHNTIRENAGAGVFLGSSNTLRYNCLADNEQYGFSMYRPQQPGGSAITNITLDHNEIVGNNTYNWELHKPSCGCTGGGKFWDVRGATVTNNWVHANKSVGLWADTNNIGFLFEGNYISDNESEGIWYEISYNFLIKNNTLIRNALVKGRAFAAKKDPFPVGAVYIAESGGDSRVGAEYSSSEIVGNYFEDNWSGVVLWESANRFCNSPYNTSSGYCTRVNPSATLASCVSGRIERAPYYDDCRWKTQNVSVHENEFRIDRAALQCVPNDYCGLQGLLSDHGTVPPWSPYKESRIQEVITFRQNNRFHDNVYSGEWRYVVYDPSRRLDFPQWQAPPYKQDAGSTKL